MSDTPDAVPAEVCQPPVDLTLLKPVLTQCPPHVSHLIPLLRETQDLYGYIPEPALGLVAKHLRTSRAHVLGVATFYGHFSLVPQGRHKVCVCRGTACHVRGSQQVLDALEGHLGVKPGGTTPDMEFTLETVACVGACALSPVMTLDGAYHGKLDARKALKVLKQYAQELQP